MVCVILVLAVLAAVSLPLLAGAHVAPSRGQFDRAVYRDQLLEVDRDMTRGVLSAREAESARLEIQRRLLAVDVSHGAVADRLVRSPRVAAAAALFVVLGSAGLYWRLGAPGLPGVPFADRPVAAEQPGATGAEAPHKDMQDAAARLEQKLRADPTNAGGWVLYGRTESMLGDWQKAAAAYKHAIDLGLKDAEVLAGFGEMQVMGADGIVSPAARDAFAAALAADSGNGVARYYLALADSQAGDGQKAVAAWLDLAAGLPEDSTMRGAIANRVAEAAKNGGFAAPPMPKGLPAEATSGGPTAEQMQAAASMPPAQRDQMINDMLEKLAARLKAEPNDLDGWLRLGRAYLVQGKGGLAVDALDHAATLKPGDPSISLQIVAALLSGLKPDDALPPRAVTLLNEVAATNPDEPEVLWYLGVVAARDGRAVEARQKWTKLLAALPANGEDAKMVQAALAQLPAK